jgi:predicted membrane protein
LIIAGVAARAAGVFIALILDILTKNQWIQLLPQIFLFGGPTLIVVGLLLYAKYVFEDVSTGTLAIALSLDYSIIVIIVACLLGFLTATYFSFAAGSRHSQVVQTRPHSSADIPDRSERF